MRNYRYYFRLFSYLILVWLVLLPGSSAIAQESITVTVDPATVVRANNRHLMGHNLSFVDKAFGTWNSDLEAFENSFWELYTQAAPGMVRFPGGNWGYGYHFNLARKGIAHRINFSSTPAQDFRPQHFLKLIGDLNEQEGVESTPLIHLSPQFTSPEEAAAWVAYMIAPADNNCRTIGTDSWGRKEDGDTEVIDWQDTCYWGQQREKDGAPRYTETLYVQLGNEEWIKSCNGCTGMTDYYGITRHQRAMTIQQETDIPPQVTAYWPKYRALWAKLRGAQGLFTTSEVKIGALGYASILDPQGKQDKFLKNQDHWNQVLLTHIANDPGSDVDFLTLHTYMYARSGWEAHSVFEKRHNVLASHDHLRARIEQIRNQVSPAFTKPIYITEYNTHLHPTDNNQPRNIPASSLIDALHTVNWTAEAMYNEAIGGLVRWQSVTKASTAENTGGGYPLLVTHDSSGSSEIWKMSSFYAAKLLTALHPKVVGVEVSEHTHFVPSGFSAATWTWWQGYDPDTRTGPPIPYLTAVATVSDDGRQLALLLLNRNTVDGYNVSLDLGNFTPDNTYSRITLDSINLDDGHDDLFDQNGFGTEAIEEVVVEETIVDGSPAVIDIGPHQASVIKFSLAVNQPPVADAGTDQTIDEVTQVILDGSDSSDADGSITAYQWRQTLGPAVILNNAHEVQANFSAPDVEEETQLVFDLTVTDDVGALSTDQVTVTVLDSTIPGMVAVLNGNTSNTPVVDFTAEQTTVQVSYANSGGYPVKGVVQKWSSRRSNWRWVTAIDETAGETVAGLSPGWLDLASQVFYYDGRWDNGRWAIPRDSTRTFRIRLKRKINGSWVWAGDWLTLKIKR